MNVIDKYLKLESDILAPSGARLAFFKGSLSPDVLFIGEAPGPDENIAGIPFVGVSGKLVDKAIDRCGLGGFQVAFLNPVFRMPSECEGKFRKPTDTEIDFYRPMALEIVDFLAPRYIVLLGKSLSGRY